MTLKNYLLKYNNSLRLSILGPMSSPPKGLLEPIIYVDGGTKFQIDAEGYSVGDGDSSTIPLDEKLSTKKDFSDLGYALNQITQPFPEIHLFGFLGGRKDHELFNLGEIFHFLQRQTEPVYANFEDVWIGYSAGTWELEIEGLFSLVTFSSTEVSLLGECKYQIPPGTEVPSITSFGLSNIGNGSIELTCAAPVFIYLVTKS